MEHEGHEQHEDHEDQEDEVGGSSAARNSASNLKGGSKEVPRTAPSCGSKLAKPSFSTALRTKLDTHSIAKQ